MDETNQFETQERARAVWEQVFGEAYGSKPSWPLTHLSFADKLANDFGLAEFERRARLLFEVGPSWKLKPPYTVETLWRKWNDLVEVQELRAGGDDWQKVPRL